MNDPKYVTERTPTINTLFTYVFFTDSPKKKKRMGITQKLVYEHK